MYDYIIVGAGSAGCVLANRLTENPLNRVLLLEAGQPDRSLKIRIPAALSQLFKTKYDWAYHTEPEANLNNRQLFIPRGKVLGGSSSINAMIYIRGHRVDYDHWKDLGNPGWGFEEVLPYFQKAESQELKSSKNIPGKKSLVSNRRYTNLLSHTFIKAATEMGFPHLDNLNIPEPEGLGLYQVTQKNGQRYSVADAYLKPILHRANLTIQTQAQVTRLLSAGNRVYGVEYLDRDHHSHNLKAEKEVILCGGAINSPQLLMLSGIGPAKHLQDLGIKTVANLPGVGQNLQDHLGVGLFYKCKQSITLDKADNLVNLLQYLLFKRGALTSNVVEAGGFVKTQPDLTVPDLQLLFGPAYFIEHGFLKPQGYGFSFGFTGLRPKSRGEIILRSGDPLTPALVKPNYLSHQSDLEVLIAGIKLGQSIANSEAFAAFLGEEYPTGRKINQVDAIAEYIQEYAQTLYHPVGTCKMGNDLDPLAVVNCRLQVHGVQGLRVIDASIMPTIVGGNTNAPTIMIAEKAADLLKEDNS